MTFSIDLNHAIAAHTLRKIFIRRPNANLLNTVIFCGQRRRGGQGIVRFKFNHRPKRYAHPDERVLERLKLRTQRRLDTVAGLVAVPQLIAEGFNHVIGGDADEARPFFDHLQDAIEHADDGAHGAILVFREASQTVKVPKQLVRAVDEVHDHGNRLIS